MNIEERLENFERTMDGVTASNNVAIAAMRLRYTAETAEQANTVVLTMPTEVWLELVEQVDMFMSVMNYIKEHEQQGESNA